VRRGVHRGLAMSTVYLLPLAIGVCKCPSAPQFQQLVSKQGSYRIRRRLHRHDGGGWWRVGVHGGGVLVVAGS
jgi:hypothetical protein